MTRRADTEDAVVGLSPAEPVPAAPTPFERSFATVLRYELDQVARRRTAVLRFDPGPLPEGTTAEDVRFRAQRMNLTGLAFSGGGIRSGTVNLGILQALASLGLVTRLDYLSTVSGGGYVGGWLAAWIRRETYAARELADPAVPYETVCRTAVENVQQQLDPSRLAQAHADRSFPGEGPDPARARFRVVDEEPEPVRHLRSYSRYLTPRAGPFSLDTWAVFSIYVRNLVITLLTVLPVIAAVILAFRLLILPFQLGSPGLVSSTIGWVSLAFSPLIVTYLLAGWSLRQVRRDVTYRTEDGRKVWPTPLAPGSRKWLRRVAAFFLFF